MAYEMRFPRAPGAAPTGYQPTAEQNRLKRILTGAEAKGRQALAEHLAFNTDLTAEQAVALLAKAPLEAQARRSDLRSAMAEVVQDVQRRELRRVNGQEADVYERRRAEVQARRPQ